MKLLFSQLLRRLRRQDIDPHQRLHKALNDFRHPEADALGLCRRLVAALRPDDGDYVACRERYESMLVTLENDAELLADFRQHMLNFVVQRRALSFFTDSGILPGTGFFSEWWHILGSRLLPEVPDEQRLIDALHLIFHRRDDWEWLEAIPANFSQRFWGLLTLPEMAQDISQRGFVQQVLDAVLLLAHRVSGLGVESELLRASPNPDLDTPRFIALSSEAQAFVDAFRAGLEGQSEAFDDASQLLVIVDQCQDSLKRIRKRALTVGTSLRLSYFLTRCEQSLQRITALAEILTARLRGVPQDERLRRWGAFSRAAFLAENRRLSLRRYWQQLSGVLAVRVTENAAQSGEHYICESRADYRKMWRAAAAAGVIIAGMAFLKIQASTLHAPLLIEAFLFSMIYGLGFVLIYLLDFTVATKQPAMTAQTLAGLLGDLKPTRSAELERIADVAAAVSRSQLAAIGGNVMLALPIALLISFALSYGLDAPVITQDKAAHLLADLDPLSWAVPHAAIAGFYLFLAGLINGYFDNQAAYANIGARVGRLRWLQLLLGKQRAASGGAYVGDHLGGIMGNFLFGCMLGSTGVIGKMLGLPLDIRHIAFSSANVGYALNGYEFQLAWQAIVLALLGVMLIGLTNLAVSFALALRMALRARQIEFTHWGPLLGAVWQRFRAQPRSFFMPPRAPTGSDPA
ncbi:site-specific recombinase [Azonexus sp.]|uniref:site-specific recombinase n=1 Tax=Azonexus sp. TaxID=1872668 RepID=UPI0039E4025F